MSVAAWVVQVGETVLAYAVILFILDYAAYFQSTLFTTLDRSGRGMDESFRSPPYHALCHWVLQLIAAVGLVVSVLSFDLDVHFDFGILMGLLIGSYLVARYILMRRGVS